MSRNINSGRHRAPGQAQTPLHVLAGNVGPTARRAAAIAATSGVILTVTAPGSLAAPAAPVVPAAVPVVQPDNVVNTTQTISVDADASWSLVSASVSSEAPPPPPPAPVVRTQQVARTNDRVATTASTTTAAAEEAQAQVQSAPATATGSAIVAYARQFAGTPYRLGGTTPAAFDCSGFTSYVFASVGVNLPRTSGQQRYAGRVVSAAEARPGDLVWWPGHVGIYTGNGNHIAARNPSTALYEGPIYHNSPTFIRVVEG